MTQRHKVSKCYWKNGIDRLAQYRVDTEPQFVKKKPQSHAISVKYNEVYACDILWHGKMHMINIT